ncbi:RDD family protein [bacterium]|nr:RDD family protein [bacterium]
MFCPNCSRENPDGAKFCTSCGREIITPQTQATASGSLNVMPVQYAGFWRRVIAVAIDSILLAIVSVPFSWDIDPFDFTFSNALGLIVPWLYFTLLESSYRQATVGKMIIGIVVTDEQLRRISFARATGRYFGKYLSAVILGIGFLMAAFTQKKQGLHDILADTIVVQK